MVNRGGRGGGESLFTGDSFSWDEEGVLEVMVGLVTQQCAWTQCRQMGY